MGKANEINALTGIRGIFAIYVMLYHINPFNSSNVMLSNGYIAVDLFFILSGFILTHVYANQFKNGVDEDNFKSFLYNRFIRIYPLYFLILSIVTLYYLSTNKYPTIFYDITSNFLFIQSITGNGFIGPAWSLSTEVIAYLLVPIMISTFFKRTYLLLISIYLSIGVLGYVAYALGRIDVYAGWQAIARCISEYVLGIGSYVLFLKIKHKDNGLLCISITMTSLILLCFRGFDLFSILLFSIVIPLIASSKCIVTRFLSSSPVLYFGEISYSIYLWHGVISRQFSEYVTNISHAIGIDNALLSMVVVTMVLSCLTYHFLELPCKNVLKKHKKKIVNA